MPKEQIKQVRNYYIIALLLNLTPFIVAISSEKINGEYRKALIILGIWLLIVTVVYSFYFLIPKFNKNWHKIIGLVFPTVLLSLLMFLFPKLKGIALILIIINIILNGIFILHFNKTLAKISPIIKMLRSKLILPIKLILPTIFIYFICFFYSTSANNSKCSRRWINL